MNVLIIEDNIGIRNALLRGFKYKNVLAEAVSSGTKGLSRIKSASYDIIIIDLLLPDLSGEKIIKEIRENEIRTPVIVLTSLCDVDTKTRILNIGADDFVEKPFSFEELYARVSAVIRRTSESSSSKHIKIHGLELIPERRVVSYNGKHAELRSKEYSLLEYFMQHPNIIASRQALMENIWGFCTSVLSNTIDSHIASLRRKIGKIYSKKIIKTVHGMGYMFISE